MESLTQLFSGCSSNRLLLSELFLNNRFGLILDFIPDWVESYLIVFTQKPPNNNILLIGTLTEIICISVKPSGTSIINIPLHFTSTMICLSSIIWLYDTTNFNTRIIFCFILYIQRNPWRERVHKLSPSRTRVYLLLQTKSIIKS